MHVDLSVSVVAYHNYEDILNMISSLVECTSKILKKQIYIIDNGTEDSNSENLNNFKKKISCFRDVIYIKSDKNVGFGAGHNLILDKIDSDYHAIVNPDIIFVEDCFSKIIPFFKEHGSVGMVVPKIIDEKGNLQKVYRRELTIFDLLNRILFKNFFRKRAMKHTMQDMNYSIPFKVPFAQGSFLVIRSELFKKLKGFDERYFMYVEDADLCRRVNDISALMYLPNAKVIHKWEQGSHKNIKLLRYHLRSIFFYFFKWGYKFK